ncbi:uncharacterized protein LOC132751135 [Ruditapes philippinarum]|uniref:uncharacterized protein LOC132751135 n=1 Tax=Ruditapes philippinarum TaxID=129788 RepID=UPI00295BF31F|nr:uncharacterized protein LOC132751135 [Ruditapes philippinarum]
MEEQTNKQDNKETMLMLAKINAEEHNNNPPFDIDSKRFSSLTKLLRVTAFVLRFIQKLKKVKRKYGYLECEELLEAENMWIKHIQETHFQSDINSIQAKKGTNRQQQLGLFLDERGLLRCTGRLENANLSEGARQPILLPRNDHFTELIVEKTHKELLHSGVSQTLATTRKRFWILHGRATVKRVLNKCVVCRRHEGGCYKMPPLCCLPRSRVTESVPFSRTGLDCFGPVYLKTTTGDEKKAWVCLLTCLVTRAVHLELFCDMTTEEFLLGYRRFIAQRGTPSHIISDNAKQFKAASLVIDKIWHCILHSHEVQSYSANANIQWKFIIELAPWMGGFYERLVGLVKRSFRKAVGRKRLTIIQAQTLIKEIEAVVNSRPLVYIGDDVNSTIALTPSHFLTLNPKIGIPQVSDENDSEYLPTESSSEKLLKIWKKGQKLLNKFWQIWKNDYLLSLRERMQTRLKASRIQSPVNPTIGDIVIVKENFSRGNWKLAKIEKLNVSRDGAIRSCQIKLASGNVLNRPMNLLFPIETTQNNIVTKERSDVNVLEEQLIGSNRNKNKMQSYQMSERNVRSAASKALKAIKQQLSE